MKKIVKKVVEKVVLAAVVLALLALAILAFLVAPVITASAEEFTISGYGPREFIVVERIERQALDMIKSWKNKPVKIVIEGHADKIGDTANNQIYALNRAEQMKEFIKDKAWDKVSDAEFIIRSKGDSANARKVVVTVEFAATTSPLLPLKFGVMILAATILISVIFVLLLLRKKGGNNQRVEWMTNIPVGAPSASMVYPEDQISSEEELFEEEELEEEIIVNTFAVKISKIGGKWYSPFKNRGGGRIFADTKREIQGSISRCLKNEEFLDQLEKLIEEGQIKKII